MSLRNALLGLLNYRPRTGYELKKIFEDSIGFYWTAKASQIYNELNKLEEKRLIKSDIQSEKKRHTRRVYKITKVGEKAFKDWVYKFPKRLTEPIRSEFLIHITFSSKIKLNELIYEINRYKREQEELIEALKRVSRVVQDYKKTNQYSYSNETFYWDLTIRKGFKNTRSNISWVHECLRLIDEYSREEKKTNNK